MPLFLPNRICLSFTESLMKRFRQLLPSLLLLVCGLLPQGLCAQMRVGEWRTHFSYSSVDDVVYTPQKVYALSNGKLFSYDPEDEVIEAYSSMDGLYGGHIRHLAYNEATETLLLVYSDGNMDFCTSDGDIANLSDFRDKSIAADKTVNQVRMFGEYAFLATKVGALLVNVEKQEICEAFMFRQDDGSYLQVNDALILGDDYYLATRAGLFVGNRQLNLLDFSSWREFILPTAAAPDFLTVWNDSLTLVSNMSVYTFNPEDSVWNHSLQYYSQLYGVDVEAGLLILERPDFITGVHRPDGSLIRYATGDTVVERFYGNVRIAFSEDASRMYAARDHLGLAIWEYNEENDFYYQTDSLIFPNGPLSNTAWKMFVKDGNVYLSGGGRWGDRYRWEGALLKFENGEWISLVESGEALKEKLGFNFLDVVSFAIDPADENHIYACTWGDGLMEFRDGALQTCHTWNNSPLVTMFPDYLPQNYVRVDGAAFDADGNFWMLNSDMVNGRGGIHIIRPDGSWLSPGYHNFYASAPSWDDILFTSNGLVWMNSERIDPGLFVVDTNGSIDDFSDDKTRWISYFVDQDGKTIDLITIHCMAEDLDGTLWIGTTHGPLLISNSRQIFDVATPVFNRVKVPRNDGTQEADYLLGNTRVHAIAVDAANRKWIGTDNDGVYLLSEDGLESIHHFTVDNSPLPSNVVYSIAVHPVTGEVFIGTEAGVVSYRSDAVQASASFASVSAYPNPVRPEFVGDVIIRGLMESSQVKITDIHGHLMASGTSLGGQFLWDLSHPSGQRVSTGVYLVYAADENGESGVVTKIVVVN